MLPIDQNIKCEYSFCNFNFIFSFQYRGIHVAVLTKPFEWKKSNFSHLCPSDAMLTSCTSHANG